MFAPELLMEGQGLPSRGKKLQKEFEALMEEEDRVALQRVSSEPLYAFITYREPEELVGSRLSDTTEILLARFEALATEAGIALRPPSGTLPRAWWLHCLFLDLSENQSKHLRMYDKGNGCIERLSEASAIFCSRLNRRSLEDAAASREEFPSESTPAKQSEGVQEAEIESSVKRGEKRCAVVMPILKAKRWSRGKLATRAGVGKNGVYEYLGGTRKLSIENRLALAEELGLKPEELPD